jgi:hypothetical protein
MDLAHADLLAGVARLVLIDVLVAQVKPQPGAGQATRQAKIGIEGAEGRPAGGVCRGAAEQQAAGHERRGGQSVSSHCRHSRPL